MHHGQWVPVYTGQSSSELQRPLCPTSYMAQGPLLMAPWLLAATSCRRFLGTTLQRAPVPRLTPALPALVQGPGGEGAPTAHQSILLHLR